MSTTIGSAPARRKVGLRTVAVAVVLGAAAVLSACSSGGRQSGATPNQGSSGQASAQANGQTTGSAGTVGTGAGGGAAEIANKLPNLRSDPLVTVPSNIPKADLQIYEVRSSAGGATVGFALHNTGTDEVSLLFQLGVQGSADAAGVSLVDPANLKRYLTLRDDKGGCACSNVSGVRMKAGESAFFYAAFTAPPTSVTRIVVETPVGSVAGVPITDV